MKRIPSRSAAQQPLSFPLQLALFLVVVFFLSVFAYTLPFWFCVVVFICVLALWEASHGTGRDWGRDDG